MGERTLVVTMSLPLGRDWAWFADSNVIGLSDRLDKAGRQYALTEVQCWWRRTCVEVADPETRPMTLVPTDKSVA